MSAITTFIDLKEIEAPEIKNILKRVGLKEERLEDIGPFTVFPKTVYPSEEMPPQAYLFGVGSTSSRRFFTHISYRLFLTLSGILGFVTIYNYPVSYFKLIVRKIDSRQKALLRKKF